MAAEPRCRPSAYAFCSNRHNVPPRIAGAFVRFVHLHGTDDTVCFDTIGSSLREVHMFLRSCRIRYDSVRPGFELIDGNPVITVSVRDRTWLDRTKAKLRRCRSFDEAVFWFIGRVQNADTDMFRLNELGGMPLHTIAFDDIAPWL